MHDDNCECSLCAARRRGATPAEMMAAMDEWHAEQITKHGWFAHFVGSAPDSNLVNFHTHGVAQVFDHPDFQIVLPLPPHVAHGFFCDLIDRVKSGEKFTDGQIVEKFLTKSNMDVLLIERQEHDRKVLRIVFPDPTGAVQQDKINKEYACQFES